MAKRKRAHDVTRERKANAKGGRKKQVCQEPRRSEAWLELNSRFPKFMTGSSDVIYAIPTELIDSVQSVSRLRTGKPLLSKNEEQFERQLARVAGNGFFQGWPFHYPTFPIHAVRETTAEEDLFNSRQELMDVRITEMMTEEMASSGRTVAQISKYFAQAADIRSAIEERQRAFAGWLVTNPSFRAATHGLRRRWGAKVQRMGSLPSLPKHFFGKPSGRPISQDKQFILHYSMLYRHWSIDQLVTWELPVPISAQLEAACLYNLEQVDPAGLVLFVPWHMLRDKKTTLVDLASLHRSYMAPEHLAAWLDGKPKNLGLKRYGDLLRLYMCWELALNRRYAKRLQRNLELFDEAFSRFLRSGKPHSPSGAESVRKLRQLYCRLLSPAGA